MVYKNIKVKFFLLVFLIVIWTCQSSLLIQMQGLAATTWLLSPITMEEWEEGTVSYFKYHHFTCQLPIFNYWSLAIIGIFLVVEGLFFFASFTSALIQQSIWNESSRVTAGSFLFLVPDIVEKSSRRVR